MKKPNSARKSRVRSDAPSHKTIGKNAAKRTSDGHQAASGTEWTTIPRGEGETPRRRNYREITPGMPRQSAADRKRSELPNHREQYDLLAALISKDGRLGSDATEAERNVRQFVIVSRTWKLSRQLCSGLAYLNPWAGDLWGALLSDAVDTNPFPGQLYAATFVSSAWCLGRASTRAAKAAVDCTGDDFARVFARAERQVRAALGARSYLLSVDVSARRDILPGRPIRLFLHFHGLLVTDAADKKILKGRFRKGLYGAPGAVITPCWDPRGWLQYSVKDSRMIDRPTIKPVFWRGRYANRSGTTQFHSRQTEEVRRCMLKMLEARTKPELCIAGGHGEVVLRNAKAAARTARRRVAEAHRH